MGYPNLLPRTENIMRPGDLQKLKHAFNEWARSHEAPDTPSLIVGKDCLTPREYAAAVNDDTAKGREIVQMHEAAMKEYGQTIDDACDCINPRKAVRFAMG
jgi:hypothetical protein